MLGIKHSAPQLEIQTLNNGKYDLEKSKTNKFSMIVFYRGYHCPVCKKYLETLNSNLAAYKDLGVADIIAVSGDTKERAQKSFEEWDISKLNIGYDLDEQTMRSWNLYLSNSIKDAEPQVFNEPGLFLIDSDKNLFYVAINSMPFGRPDLEGFHKSLKFIIDEDYPARGQYREARSIDESEHRENTNHVDDMFIDRWSPRAFDKDYHLTEDQLNKLFGAAKWTPSCYNEQPWSFRVATNDSPQFQKFLDLLVDMNQDWAKNASAIVFIIGRKKFAKNDKDNSVYQFDCGAAWMSLTMQARLMGLYTHGMAGIKKDDVNNYFDLDTDKQEVICGFAVGKNTTKDVLPEKLQEKEHLRGRNDLDEFVEFYS
ncbi:MAG: hypothetical protein CME62_15525 [Halobacteriovoraceae bacterium]|nr:hypothetical protein [Halobacteriovoraceae bacterium]|tara:strand:- start:15549 stop:16655 length:1107 start_codon:yes stop_codon:yes gene_type:complete